MKCARLVVLGLLLCQLVGTASCSKASDTREALRVGTNVWVGFEPLYVARELDLMNESSVKLVEYTSTTQVLAAFRTGVIDAAALTLDEAILLVHAGERIRVALVLDYSFGGDVLLAKPEFADTRALRGKRIAVEQTALGAYTLALALAKGDLTASDVVIVPAEADEHEYFYAQPDIHAVVTFEPMRSRLLRKGAKVLFSSKEAPGKIIDVLVVREDALKSKKALLEQLLIGWFAGLEHVKGGSTPVLEIMAKRTQLELPALRKAISGVRYPDAAENRAFLTGTSPRLDAAVSGHLEFMKAQGLIAPGSEIHLRPFTPGEH